MEHLRDFGKDIALYVNQPDENGLTALHYAASCETGKFERGSVPMIELLLKAGALINAQDKNGQTPLHKNLEIFENKKTSKPINDKFCCHYNKFVVQCLLENRATPNIANHKKITPLQLLEKYKHILKKKTLLCS